MQVSQENCAFPFSRIKKIKIKKGKTKQELKRDRCSRSTKWEAFWAASPHLLTSLCPPSKTRKLSLEKAAVMTPRPVQRNRSMITGHCSI